jgi:hypothetical protein
MKFAPHVIALALAASLGACVAPVGPVEVTRFHDPLAASRLGTGPITVVLGEGMQAGRLEADSYAAAVSRELAKAGYNLTDQGAAGGQRAVLMVEREAYGGETARSPVSIGIGGSTGSFGSGIGIGIGLNLSGPPPQQITTRLSLRIEGADGKALWEGRAQFTARADSPLSQTQLGAAKMAEALFRDFPGNNGETVEVR